MLAWIWPHWLMENWKKVKPFDQKDDGLDLVESFFISRTIKAMFEILQKSATVKERSLPNRNKRMSYWREIGIGKLFNTRNVKILYWHGPHFAWI